MPDLQVFWLVVAFFGGAAYAWALSWMSGWLNDRSMIAGTKKEKADA